MRDDNIRSVLMIHPDQLTKTGELLRGIYPLAIPEDRVIVARAQQWIVLATDSDILGPRSIDMTLVSNPRRVGKSKKKGYEA